MRLVGSSAMVVSLIILATFANAGAVVAQPAPDWSIALHGGAGVIQRAELDPATEAAYRRALAAALEAGSKVLRDGGSALDAAAFALNTPGMYRARVASNRPPEIAIFRDEGPEARP